MPVKADIRADTGYIATAIVRDEEFADALDTHRFGIPILFSEGQTISQWYIKCKVCGYYVLFLGGEKVLGDDDISYLMKGVTPWGYGEDEKMETCSQCRMKRALL